MLDSNPKLKQQFFVKSPSISTNLPRMEHGLTVRFRSPAFPLFNREPVTPVNNSTPTYVTMAKKKPGIEGVGEELNMIASWNMDYAPARRQVRSAFMEVQHQLDHCLFKMAPSGIRTKEWYELNSNGLEIFCKSWLPPLNVSMKGVLFFCHGYGDTCTFFFEGIAKRIAGSGYGVYALDHPGFGLSDGLHGFISSFDGLADNIIEIYTKIKGRPELRGLPHFLLGQSMGGAVAIKVHLKDTHGWNGVILVAPMCKIAEDVTPPEAILKVANCLSKVVPVLKFFPQQDLAAFSFRDSKKMKMADYNVICYSDRVRLKTAMELLKATSEIEKQLDKVSAPLLIIHGAADKVTDPQVSQFLYDKASTKDKTIKLYEGGYHCILEGEPDDRIFSVFDDMIAWLDARCTH